MKKRYGQHFLRDTGILDRIVRLMAPAPDDLIIEIGAGDGALSIRLAPRVSRLLAVEIDPDLLPLLGSALAPFPSASVIGGDFLAMDVESLVAPYAKPGIKLRIAGNLPYNIGTAIIEKLLTLDLHVEDMIFMLQLETVVRIIAKPGTRQYGFFSVLCQHYCFAEMSFKVSPACFVPRPRVDSAVLTLRPRRSFRDPGQEAGLLEVTKAAFAYRRKKLINALRHNARFGRHAADILAAAGIDGARRAEDLTVDEYERLARRYSEFKARNRTLFAD